MNDEPQVVLVPIRSPLGHAVLWMFSTFLGAFLIVGLYGFATGTRPPLFLLLLFIAAVPIARIVVFTLLHPWLHNEGEEEMSLMVEAEKLAQRIKEAAKD